MVALLAAYVEQTVELLGAAVVFLLSIAVRFRPALIPSVVLNAAVELERQSVVVVLILAAVVFVDAEALCSSVRDCRELLVQWNESSYH